MKQPISRTPALISVLAIVLLAAVLRFYRLAELPPGLWFDEAWSSVAARNSAAQGLFPVYFAANFGGLHPAIVYLARLANALSDNPLSLRYAVAVVSTCTVAVSFIAYRTIFALGAGGANSASDSPAFNLQSLLSHPQFLAFLATLILAITYPFVHFSRLGLESGFAVLAGLLMFGSLAVAMQRERAGWFALMGGLLGLSLYTCNTARLFPFALSVAYWGVVVVRGRGKWRRYLGWYGLLVATAVVAFLPLGLYLLTHWSVLTTRASVVAYNTLGPGAESVPLAILRNVGRTVGGLFLPGLGDHIARHNLPGRPMFDPFLALLFGLGTVALARKWKRPSSILLTSWAGVMLLPVILADGAPTYSRIFGAVPALCAMAALSGEFGSWIAGLRARSRQSAVGTSSASSARVWQLAVLPLLLLLLLSLGTTARDYFGRWAALPQLFDDFQLAEWQAGRLVQAGLVEGDVFLVPNQVDDAHPTLDWLLRGTAVRAFPPTCLVCPTAGERPFTYLIHTPTAPSFLTTLRTTFPTGRLSAAITSPLTGQTLYEAFTVAEGQSSIVSPPLPILFGEAIQLVTAPTIRVATTAVSIHLTWQAVARPAADHTLFVHFYPAGEEKSPPLSQLDVQPCLPTGQWRPGDVIQEAYVLALPADLPPGDYTLALGWYTWPTLERLPLTSGAALEGNRFLVAKLSFPDSLWQTP
jgi:hypothetical protein